MLKEVIINKCYESRSGETNLIDDFYIPVLEVSTQYYRIAGFFNSTSLKIASKGIEGLLSNSGSMKLLVSPQLSDQDREIIEKFNTFNEHLDIFNGFNEEDFQNNDHLKMLAWMLKFNKLEIKIVVPLSGSMGMFHQKIGILLDCKGNGVSFSGSINESANAWLNNIEEFKTFKSWEDDQSDYFINDLDKFRSYWQNDKTSIAKVYDLPDAIKKNIIKVAPNSLEDINAMNEYISKKNSVVDKNELFDHQKDAIQMWLRSSKQMLFEMATGTGKTRMALGCVKEVLKDNNRILVIIATPQNTLSRQWKNEIDIVNMGIDVVKIIDGTNANWSKDLEVLALDISSGTINQGIVLTTHDTCSASKFIEIIKSSAYNCDILFICDEVHAIGSQKQRNALLDMYNFRIGLSATPSRLFDIDGTKAIYDFFGNTTYEFTISDALKTINPRTGRPFLNHYYYKPIFLNLTNDESTSYQDITRKIAILMSSEEYDESLVEKLYFTRANIVKNAEQKLPLFYESIISLVEQNINKDIIVFASDKQIINVVHFLSNQGIVYSKITESEGTSATRSNNYLSERQEIIDNFKKNKISVLIGIKCLDEGIDIPNARIAFLLSNSLNPREYIQRIGRVIRYQENKSPSIIYDFIVKPCNNDLFTRVNDQKVFDKEISRSKLIMKDAINLNEVIDIFRKEGVEIAIEHEDI